MYTIREIIKYFSWMTLDRNIVYGWLQRVPNSTRLKILNLMVKQRGTITRPLKCLQF